VNVLFALADDTTNNVHAPTAGPSGFLHFTIGGPLCRTIVGGNLPAVMPNAHQHNHLQDLDLHNRSCIFAIDVAPK
jgi:hypothetical protein